MAAKDLAVPIKSKRKRKGKVKVEVVDKEPSNPLLYTSKPEEVEAFDPFELDEKDWPVWAEVSLISCTNRGITNYAILSPGRVDVHAYKGDIVYKSGRKVTRETKEWFQANYIKS